MKHVLVLDALQDSIGFLNAQRLKWASALQNMQYDTVKLGRHLDAMQSVDGIQFYHFTRQVNPALNMGHFKGGEHIETYLDTLKTRLDVTNKAISNPERKEKLDAIVITGGVLENISTVRFIAKLRKTWPDVTVMVTKPRMHTQGNPPRLFVKELPDPLPPMYSDVHWLGRNNNRALYQPIRQDTEGFALDKQITLATPNAPRDMQANILREAIGMPPLPTIDPYAAQRAERVGHSGGRGRG